jgi:hypothetical protein
MSTLRLSVVVVLLLASNARADWGPETRLTMTNADVWGEGIATSGTTVHLMYGTNEVRYRNSTDEGKTWNADMLIDTGVIHLTDPIVADGNDVWMIYLKDIQNKTDWCCSRDLGNIYLLHSGNAGQTWDTPKKLTSASGAYRVSMTYDSGRLHVVWRDYRSTAWDTYYLRSVDRGATWETEKRIAISAGTFGAERPQIAARGNSIHVTIWDDRGSNPPCMAGPTFSFASCPDTFYIRSLDGGVTWGTEVNVTNSGAAIAGRNDIAAPGASSVVINFNRSTQNTADANPHMFTIRSPDNGATWETPVQLTNTPGQADHGSIIASGSAVHLAWHDSRAGSLAIYYVGSSTEGETWNPEELVSTTTTTDSSTPLLAVTSGFVHAMWLDHRSGTWQVYYRRRAVPPVAAGPDAGAAATPDGGTDPMAGSPGCGCKTSHGAGSSIIPAMLALMILRRRRR